jgi:acetyltransferase
VVALLDDPSVHIGIVWLQLMTAHVDTLVRIFCEIRDRSRKPWFVCWVAAPEAALHRLRAEGIVVFSAGERAVEAAAALARHGEFLRRRAAAPPAVLVQPAGPSEAADGVQPSVQATEWLRAAGVPMAPVALARSADEAVALWRTGGRAVALKIESPDITHKTEVGGVLLGLDDEAALRAGFDTLLARARQQRPQARLDGVLVQPMAGGHLELVVGVQRDAAFGPVVMVGFGGVLVEVLKDVAFRRAPFDDDEALAMLAELRMAPLLDGVRGQPAVDRLAIARLLSGLSRWAAAMQPRLAELDLNPVRVGPEGPLAVDCVMVFRSPQPQGDKPHE